MVMKMALFMLNQALVMMGTTSYQVHQMKMHIYGAQKMLNYLNMQSNHL